VAGKSEFLGEPRVKVLLPGDPAGLNPVEAAFRQSFSGRANMFRSKPYFFEVLPRDADKGLALGRLAALHGIRRESVMAVGDSWNDEGMLRWAGWPVAMANAAADIRRIAAWVTTRSHDDDGVAEAIDRFILGNRGGTGGTVQ
jgi:hydroxymethylpyrimidine pyrophosphatase-like HAD family hydrolase